MFFFFFFLIKEKIYFDSRTDIKSTRAGEYYDKRGNINWDNENYVGNLRAKFVHRFCTCCRVFTRALEKILIGCTARVRPSGLFHYLLRTGWFICGAPRRVIKTILLFLLPQRDTHTYTYIYIWIYKYILIQIYIHGRRDWDRYGEHRGRLEINGQTNMRFSLCRATSQNDFGAPNLSTGRYRAQKPLAYSHGYPWE